MVIKKRLKEIVTYFGYEIRKLDKKPIEIHELKNLSYCDVIYCTTETTQLPIFYVDIDIIRNKHFYSYSKDGWHPFTAFLKEYISNPSIDYDNSILKRYYELFKPKNQAEALFVQEDETMAPLNSNSAMSLLMPWSLYPRIFLSEKHLDKSHGMHIQGPVSREKGKFEFNRLIELYLSIKTHGYDYSKESATHFISGFFLRKGNDWRFILTSGHHRTAVLSALNYFTIPMTFKRSFPRVIDYEDINEWPQVKKGHISRNLAEKVFLEYFNDNGVSKAKKIGILQ